MKVRIAAWLSPRIPGPLRRFILRRVLRRQGLGRRRVKAVRPVVDAIAGSRTIMRSVARAARRLGR
mgnify:CR=1 FL=1